MAQSQNSSVELTIKATYFNGLATYGNMMLGNKALEFYNERNPEDYVQLPWDEIDHVAASVIFGRTIPRFVVFTKTEDMFSFSTRDNKETLRHVREHIGNENVVRSPSFLDVVKAGVKSIFRRVK